MEQVITTGSWSMNGLATIEDVKSRMLMVRGEASLLDRDVAALYGVEIKAINQAVKNNKSKFPDGYVLSLEPDEIEVLRSKFLTIKNNRVADITRNTGTRCLLSADFTCSQQS